LQLLQLQLQQLQLQQLQSPDRQITKSPIARSPDRQIATDLQPPEHGQRDERGAHADARALAAGAPTVARVARGVDEDVREARDRGTLAALRRRTCA
jgi:hypothetical protein